jgi:hypothetical protein
MQLVYAQVLEIWSYEYQPALPVKHIHLDEPGY